jgi:hypothetical protein
MKSVAYVPPVSLDELPKLAGPALKPLYAQVVGHPPPHKASARFMRLNIAWCLQARQAGHDPDVLRRQLIKRLQAAVKVKRPVYKPGTRLVREWQGKVYEVTILDKGYSWRGKVYGSLTPIATEITGTPWSGPRFFGLKSAKA